MLFSALTARIAAMQNCIPSDIMIARGAAGFAAHWRENKVGRDGACSRIRHSGVLPVDHLTVQEDDVAERLGRQQSE